MARELTTEQLSEILDIDESQISRWVAKGLPHDGSGRKGKPRLFDETEVAAWMKANNITGKPGRPPEVLSKDLEQVRIRKETAMAESWELRNAKDKGILVEKAEVERKWTAIATVIRNKLLGFPSSVAPILVGRDVAEIESLINKRVREILEELSRS